MRKADKTRAKEERDREKLALKREKEAKAIAASRSLESASCGFADLQDHERMDLGQDLRLLLHPTR